MGVSLAVSGSTLSLTSSSVLHSSRGLPVFGDLDVLITVADTEDTVVVLRTTGSIAIQFYVGRYGDFSFLELFQFPLHEVEDLLVGLEGVWGLRRLQLFRVGAQVEEAIAILGAFEHLFFPVGPFTLGAGVTGPS